MAGIRSGLWSIAALVALLGTLALAACGGDGDEGGGDVIAQADAICTEAFEAEPPQVSNIDSSPELSNEILAGKIEVADQRRADLEALQAPEEAAGEWEQFVENEAERVRLGEQQLQAVEEGDQGTVDASAGKLRELAAEQADLAGQIGFEVCGLGRYASGDPEPEVSLEERVAELAEAVSQKDCRTLVEISGTELVLPEAQQQGYCDAVSTDFEGFDAEAAEIDEWGTAAVIENESPGGSVISQPLLLDGDETFRLTTVFQNQPAVGTEPEPDAEFDQVAEQAVEAIREGDCEAIGSLYDPDAFASVDDACSAFTSRLGTAAQEDAELAPEPLGSNAWFAAYALRSSQGGYYTMLVSRKDGDDSKAEEGGEYRVSAIVTPFR